jgi:hypothetical protein
MMGRIHTAASFSKTLAYCLEDKRLSLTQGGGQGRVIYKDRAEIIGFNQCFGNRQELLSQFREVSRLDPNMSLPVLHISLSFPPRERLSKGRLVEIAGDCARSLDFDRHQFVTILHKDTAQQHIHLVANRIGFDRHTFDDSFSYGKIADYCRSAERRLGLVQEPGPRRYQTAIQRLSPRKGMRLDRLRQQIGDALFESMDYPAFEQSMRQRGYTVFKSRGIAFMDKKKVVIKGSEAGYPWHAIESALEKKQRLRQEEIHDHSHRQQISYRLKISGL